jgi:3-deoxy-D-manno-octulosonic-acid transferase
MLEPALRGKPVLYGPHTTNFREEAELLVSAGGARVVADGAALGLELERLLGDPEAAARMGRAGREAVAARNGAVRETLELVARYLHPGPDA